MTAAVFEARHCPTWLNEIKKTKLYSHTKPAAGINFLLPAGHFVHRDVMGSPYLYFFFVIVRVNSLSRLTQKSPRGLSFIL